MKPNKAVALKTSKLLDNNNMSKYKLVSKSGITKSALRYMFNEVNQDVHLSTIIKICKAFNVELKDFFNEEYFKIDNFDV